MSFTSPIVVSTNAKILGGNIVLQVATYITSYFHYHFI
ncbi:hypothetical protein D046_7041 [Vibrio parahaemolyticus V-223/04]|nr:hypothetical protein D046_7041 [Vibrio parahaemolyticus V-223/04]